MNSIRIFLSLTKIPKPPLYVEMGRIISQLLLSISSSPTKRPSSSFDGSRPDNTPPDTVDAPTWTKTPL